MFKNILFIASFLLINACVVKNNANAADNESFEIHKIVIQMNKRDPDLQEEVIANIVNISKYYGIDNVEIELVAYGPGIYFLSKQSKFKKRIEALMMQDVTFTVCGNTLEMIKRVKGIDLDLIEDVVEVKNGIPRIMWLQEHGFSYLSP